MINNSGKELLQYRTQQQSLKIDHKLESLGGGNQESLRKWFFCEQIPKLFAIMEAAEIELKCQNLILLFQKSNIFQELGKSDNES